MALHPQAQAFLDQMQALGRPSLAEMAVPDARAMAKQMAQILPRGPEVASVTDLSVDGAGGPIPIRLYRPEGTSPMQALVWFHGGGFVIGGVDEADSVCRQLVSESGIVVASVDYRLAPEHPYPAAADDSFAATSWLSANAANLGLDAARLAVGGDSAGGNLAAVVSLRARDEGRPPIAFQLLVYPVTDATMSRESYKQNGEGYFLTTDAMRWFLDRYLPDPSDRTDPYAAPLAAKDLSGLPPALVITAEYDPLRDEGEAYGARLREAGVLTTVSRYEGMMHGFFTMAASFDDGARAMSEACAALRAAQVS